MSEDVDVSAGDDVGAVPADTCRVFLVRHGETAWNAEHRIQVLTLKLVVFD